MTTAEIIVIAVALVLLLLGLGGRAVLRRRQAAGASAFKAEIEVANRDLAEAHAADNGWEPSRVAEAARAAFAEQRPGVQVRTLELVQVIDPPGTDDDKAVFHVDSADGAHGLVLGRHGDRWHLESLD